MDLLAFGQSGKARLAGTKEITLHPKLLASPVNQLGIIGMMNPIIRARMIVENNGGAAFAQLGISHQRSSHWLLNRKNRAYAEIVTMSQVTTDQGTGRAS